MSPDAISALWLSLKVSMAATALVALIGIPIAYLLARRRFWGHAVLDTLVTLPLILPPTVTGYYLIVLLGRLLQLTATVMALPLLVRTAAAAIASVDRELEKAAFTLGRSEWRTAIEITLPLARNGILAGLVLAFAPMCQPDSVTTK